MRRTAATSGLGLMLFLPAALLIVGGCAKPTFNVVEKKVCKRVDASGNPLEETTTFAPEDARACVWFRYRNASPGQAIKVVFKHTDELGNEFTEEVETELRVGSSTGTAELSGEDGGPLVPGEYEATITNEADVAYGPALTFTVR